MGDVSPGSEGIPNVPFLSLRSSSAAAKPGLSDFLKHHESPRSMKSGSSSIHSDNSRKARSIFSKKRRSSRRSARVIDEIKSTSSTEGKHSQEKDRSMELYQALENGSWKVLYERLLALKESTDVEKIAEILAIPHHDYESTLLHTAVWKAPPALTKVIMDMVSSLKDPSTLCLALDADGNTPLHLCCANLPLSNNNTVDVSVMKRLANAAPSALRLANEFGDTPMHMLVSSPVCCNEDGHNDDDESAAEEAVSCLLGIDENVCRLQDATGALPLHIALGCGAHEAVLMKLLEAAPTVATAKDELGMLPLHYCAAKGKTPLAVVDLLMEAHPESFTEVTVNGDTPLHILASNAATSMTYLSKERMSADTENMIMFLLGSARDDDDSRATDEASVISYAGHRRPLLACNKEQVRDGMLGFACLLRNVRWKLERVWFLLLIILYLFALETLVCR